jgi:hypothetical protein
MLKTVERWTGNGGQMAKSTEKRLEPVGKTGGKTTGKKADSAGMRALRKAADKTVEDNSARITASLLKEILEGKLRSGKMLFELAEPQAEKEGASKRGRRRSVAMELAAEPEWQELVTDASAETMGGSRKSED